MTSTVLNPQLPWLLLPPRGTNSVWSVEFLDQNAVPSVTLVPTVPKNTRQSTGKLDTRRIAQSHVVGLMQVEWFMLMYLGQRILHKENYVCFRKRQQPFYMELYTMIKCKYKMIVTEWKVERQVAIWVSNVAYGPFVTIIKYDWSTFIFYTLLNYNNYVTLLQLFEMNFHWIICLICSL